MFPTMFKREKSTGLLKVTVLFMWLPVTLTSRRNSEREEGSWQMRPYVM